MEQGESVVEGAVRELLEESCLNISWWNSFHRTGVFGFLVASDEWRYGAEIRRHPQKAGPNSSRPLDLLPVARG